MNFKILNQIQKAGKKVVVVTKYFDVQKTQEILSQVKNHPAFLALGENRINDLEAKHLPRESVHFIGNLQSRDIPRIVQNASVIHSLWKKEHVELLNKLCVQWNNHSPLEKGSERGLNPPHSLYSESSPFSKGGGKLQVFLQINISREPQKGGILPEDFKTFLKQIQTFENINILGISSMGAGEFTTDSKHQEFQELKDLRDKYLPYGKISAGTSRDWEIALEEGIDVVRVGQSLFNL
ncbi:alanine racemase [Candidatus Gracilibacteria bacterium]|nr:alanine racemase [Candidatus Gracilibacteria bacterium]